MLNDFYPYAKEYLGFDKDASINFVSDKTNAANPLGKTAYYDPSNYSVTIYTDNRHPKDIMRSVAHELVHHAQNCSGELSMSEDTGEGYAQNNQHLRDMETDAYKRGNLCFRDWEDGVKTNQNPATTYEQKDIRRTHSMNNFKNLTENFQNFLQQESEADTFNEGDKVKDLRNNNEGTVVEPMAGGAVIELDDGSLVKTRSKFLEKVEGEPMQEGGTMGEYGRQDAAAGRPASKVGRKNKEYMDAYNQEKENQISSREKKFGDALDAISEARMGEYGKMDAEQGLPPTKIGRGNAEYMAAYNAVLQARDEEPLDVQKPDQDYLDALRSGKLEERAWTENDLTPDQWQALKDIKASGKTSDFDAFEQLQKMGLADARHLGGGQYEFTISKNAEQALADLDADADETLLRNTIKDILDTEGTSVGAIQSSMQLARLVGQVLQQPGIKEAGYDEDDIKMTVGEMQQEKSGGGGAINRGYMEEPEDGFGSPAHYQESDNKEEYNGQMEEGFRDSDEEKEMMAKMSNKELYKYLTRDRHTVPDLKGDMGPMDGMEGPFQFRSGAVLYYDPKAGKYYDRSKDMYLDNEEASELTMEAMEYGDPKLDYPLSVGAPELKSFKQAYEKMTAFHGKYPSKETDKVLTLLVNLNAAIKDAETALYRESINMENDTMESNNTTSLREKVKTAVMSKLSEMFDDDDMYGDEDPYMAGLEAEFPWLKGKDSAAGDEDAAMAAAAKDAAMSGEFQSDEEEMEEPTVMNETYDDEVYDKADKVVDALGYTDTLANLYQAMDTREFLGNLEYISRMNDIDIPEDAEDDRWNVYDMVREAMGDEQFLQATLQAMSTEDATQTLDFIMTNYGIGEGEDDMYETTLRDRVMKRVQEVIGQTEESTETVVSEDASDETFAMLDTLTSGLSEREALEAVIQALDVDTARGTLEALIRDYDLGAGAEEMDEAKGKYDDGDGKDEKCDYVDCEDKEEVKEETVVNEEAEEEVTEEVEEVEEAIANNPEDFYRQLRNESRVVNRPDWNGEAKSKRSSVLNERLMKAWFTK